MRSVIRTSAAAALTALGLVAASVPAFALTGTNASNPTGPLFAVHEGPSDPAGCSKLGVSTPTFSGVVGITVGPHSGRYLHLDGEVTLGPQVHSVDPDDDPIYGFPAEYGPATDVSGTFSIADHNGDNAAVTGTIDSLAAPMSGSLTNVGSCYGVGPGNHFGWNDVTSGALTVMDLIVNYTYTEGSETRSGTAMLRQRQTVGVLPVEGTHIGYTGGVMIFHSPTLPVGQDDTAPQITVSAPAEAAAYSLHETVTAQYSCDDDTDPAPTCQGSVPSGAAIDTSSLGAHTFTVATSDAAGNTASTTVQYTVVAPPPAEYGAAGFFAPVDADVLNLTRAGQTVPLKFQLSLGGEPVLDLAAVTVRASSLSCASGETPDQLEEYATGGKGLLNLGGGRYQFNWAPPKSTRGPARR